MVKLLSAAKSPLPSKAKVENNCHHSSANQSFMSSQSPNQYFSSKEIPYLAATAIRSSSVFSLESNYLWLD